MTMAPSMGLLFHCTQLELRIADRLTAQGHLNSNQISRYPNLPKISKVEYVLHMYVTVRIPA